ncbi:Dynein light chain, type 1/2 [Penicillium occitanis (nom. inval.)]|nr:Dynein light chain, type 1/2 [Penicillium occitanis (nom. inval.)]
MATEKQDKLAVHVRSVDMTEDMQQEAIEVATEAMEKFHMEKDIAQHIKKEFDSRKGATWHCIVGRNFGSFVTHGGCSINSALCPKPSTDSVYTQRRNTSSTSTSATALSSFSKPNDIPAVELRISDTR